MRHLACGRPVKAVLQCVLACFAIGFALAGGGHGRILGAGEALGPICQDDSIRLPNDAAQI